MPRGKIKEPLAPEISEIITLPGLQDDIKRSYQIYLDINKAHVLMLMKQGIVTEDVGRQILEVNQEMSAMGWQKFKFDPELEDTYFNLEAYLIKKVGLEVGGQQHTARSRNDLLASVYRIATRNAFLDLCHRYVETRRTLLSLARRTTDAVMSGYTHLQPSEPITFGHYCSAILSAMERDYDRFSNVWKSMNRCPLGGCAMGSTTFKIDRDYTCRLLGFDKPIENSLDCVSNCDYILELISTLTIAAGTFSRLCTDLYTWATPEYGYVEVSDSVAICSSIMPQKKNPITLEFVRAQSAHMESLFVGAWGAVKNTPYTHTVDNNACVPHYIWPSFNEFIGELRLLNVTLGTLNVKKPRMLKMAASNFCTVTELANTLVRKDGISFRAAHEIVALVVDKQLKADKTADQIDSRVVDEASEELFGKAVGLSDEEIRLALDPTRSVYARVQKGGSAPSEASRQLNLIERRINEDEALINERETQIQHAKDELEKEVRAKLA